jgi:ubiquitin-protein ligase
MQMSSSPTKPSCLCGRSLCKARPSRPTRLEYPFKHPQVKFLTKTYVHRDEGVICDNLLGEGWSPEKRLSECIAKVYKMLEAPEVESLLDPEIGDQFKWNHKKYVETAQDWTKKYAKK